MAIVTGDRYLERLVKFLEEQAESLIEETQVLKLNPAGLHYVHLRLEALRELERMLSGAPVDYLRAYVSDLGDFRALEQLRRILRILTSLKVFSTLPPPARDPTPLSLLPFGRLKVLELRGCDLSTSAAKGLLELRHTLEKIICHNSTDALRHVFASRIAEIKDSPRWNKLTFVSCACNRLLLMDESLQLLPVVESLDLSRNKVTKVDNLHRCTKLKEIDLGFNHLRTVSHLTEVSSHIVKLVLRNNALTTLRGIENLKSLEGLDVSYNMISNFTELEFLGSLSVLKDLWLEGNPVCSARWYREHVFSYFVFPNNLKLDGTQIGTREYWKMQIIVAQRHRQPASYGFYSPARGDAAEEEIYTRKKKKICRLASIDSEKESTYICSDQESASCDHETQSKEENAKSDNEADISSLINKVEHLKRERSVLWLREFKEWMDCSSEDLSDVSKDNLASRDKSDIRHLGETSRYAVGGSLQASRDKNEIKNLESSSSRPCMDQSINTHGISCADDNEAQQKHSHDEMESVSVAETQTVTENENMSALDTIRDMAGAYSSFTYLGSPPHYQKDVLHRRDNLVEEILQLSADTYSVASSDSTSSCSEDEIYDSEQSNPEEDHRNISGGRHLSGVSKDYDNLLGDEIAGSDEKRAYLHDSQEGNNDSMKAEATNVHHGFHNANLAFHINQIDIWFEKRRSRKKPKKRIVSLLEEKILATNGETSQRSKVDISGSDEDKCTCDHVQEGVVTTTSKLSDNDNIFSDTEQSYHLLDDDFKLKPSDSGIMEACRHYLLCDCILEKDATYEQREVVLLLSGPDKPYILHVGVFTDSPGSSLSIFSSHRIEDIQNVTVGLGLQFVRLCFREDAEFIFITKSIEKTTALLNIIQVFDPQGTESQLSLESLEHVQVEYFEKEICRGLKLSIFQYNVVHFQTSSLGETEEWWCLRSLYVAGGHLFVCSEDFRQLRSLPESAASAPYISLDSCCSISDISELVIEREGSGCMELEIKDSNSREGDGDDDGSVRRWKLKWAYTEEAVKFITLLKALHLDTSEQPLHVRHMGPT